MQEEVKMEANFDDAFICCIENLVEYWSKSFDANLFRKSIYTFKQYSDMVRLTYDRYACM